jgi:hypothetical protein
LIGGSSVTTPAIRNANLLRHTKQRCDFWPM